MNYCTGRMAGTSMGRLGRVVQVCRGRLTVAVLSSVRITPREPAALSSRRELGCKVRIWNGQLGESSGGGGEGTGPIDQSQFPDSRRVRSGDHCAEPFGDEGRRLRYERSPGTG